MPMGSHRNLCDTDVFASHIKVIPALVQRHDTAPALAWCGEHRSQLRRLGKSRLELYVLRLHVAQMADLLKKQQVAVIVSLSRHSP